MESIARQGLLDAILARNLKFGLGYGGLVQVGFVSGGSGGPEPPACVSERLKSVESP